MKLKNCPFCDGKAYHQAYGVRDFKERKADTYQIICFNCECSTPSKTSLTKVQKIWNTRVVYYK